ncbi:MAG: hypothetical protein JRH18_05170 [Deltaproteobacteria bacterium]|nr:hypothetical protein [Deltaproteobacteria bacterium]MBW2151037.1 hypothetical protein [Deltaproteobacteria bacterium]
MIRLIFSILSVFLLCFAVQATAGDLPESVQKQSRKLAIETKEWKKFDRSGKVKFLQVQTTSAASHSNSGSKLDGSSGERIIEIKVDPALKENIVNWSFKNKGPTAVWVVAAGSSESALPIRIEKGTTENLKTTLDEDRYTYIVVDNEGGKKTTLEIKAKCGETAAKTTRGKSMKIIWF